MQLTVTVNRVTLQVELPGVRPADHKKAGRILDESLRRNEKNREAIALAFLHLLRKCPDANASDLWHHVVYRQYLEILPKYRPQDPAQSWKRASGDALEVVIQRWYAPVLAPHEIEIEMLVNDSLREASLKAMSINEEVGAGKLDMAFYARMGKQDRVIIGGLHVKGSLAERVSDDVPTSRAIMMNRGFLSPLWTLDVKSFPPPQGDLVNRGELGSPDQPSEKRKYIEQHGDFDNCYSANSRTIPSSGETPSGKRIYAISFSDKMDQFSRDVIAHVERLRSQR